jgi:hypothetical protein
MLAVDEPVSVESALVDPNWRVAMNSELQAIEANKTWSWPELPNGQKAIGLKWVFKLKKNMCPSHQAFLNGDLRKYMCPSHQASKIQGRLRRS